MIQNCPGCGRPFAGERALRSHQASRRISPACGPTAAPDTLKLSIRMKSVMLSGLDAGVMADGSGSRSVVGDRRTLNALERRGIIVWRAVEETGRTHRPLPYLTAFGRAEAKLVHAELNS